jgi:acyl-CoA thioesterase
MPLTLSQQIGVTQTGPDEYRSNTKPMRMGNHRPISYGGFTAAIAVHSAGKSVPSSHKLYSVVGHFLGPTQLEEPVRCKVTHTRDTRSFATRRVEVYQAQKDGQTRKCLELIADFHIEEPDMLAYSAPPTRSYSSPQASTSRAELQEQLQKKGKISLEDFEVFGRMFTTQEQHFDIRFCPEGLSADDGEQWAALAFLMDGGLAFLPLVHEKITMSDTHAWSSLDFALRLFRPKIHMNDWHIRERVSHAAGVGRTFSESRIWDEQGTLVASMTQQSILRLKPEAKASL